jgi:hypothetical protein
MMATSARDSEKQEFRTSNLHTINSCRYQSKLMVKLEDKSVRQCIATAGAHTSATKSTTRLE